MIKYFIRTIYNQDLTLDKLFGWHNALFPKGFSGFHKINTATFRGDEVMQIVGGYAENEKFYYEAPPRDILENEMQSLRTNNRIYQKRR